MNISHELTVFFTSMLPVLELRGAIPLGFKLGLPAEASFLIAILGNMVPVFFILWFLGPFSKLLMKYSKFFDKFFTKLFKRAHDKHIDSIEKYGPIVLILFVAIPLPGSGAWTGSLVAFLFGIRYWKAVGLISIGVVIAGILLTLASMGVISLF